MRLINGENEKEVCFFIFYIDVFLFKLEVSNLVGIEIFDGNV